MMYDIGFAISCATSLSRPGGRLSIPVDLWRLSFRNSRSTNTVGTYPKWKVVSVLFSIENGDFQTNWRSGKVFSFRLLATDEKKLQKELAFVELLSVGTLTFFFPGKIDLIVCQNFRGLLRFSVKRDWWYWLFALRISVVHVGACWSKFLVRMLRRNDHDLLTSFIKYNGFIMLSDKARFKFSGLYRE